LWFSGIWSLSHFFGIFSSAIWTSVFSILNLHYQNRLFQIFRGFSAIKETQNLYVRTGIGRVYLNSTVKTTVGIF
jgi:hypothetical protein